jgi:hypothetical protein
MHKFMHYIYEKLPIDHNPLHAFNFLMTLFAQDLRVGNTKSLPQRQHVNSELLQGHTGDGIEHAVHRSGYLQRSRFVNSVCILTYLC